MPGERVLHSGAESRQCCLFQVEKDQALPYLQPPGTNKTKNLKNLIFPAVDTDHSQFLVEC